MNQVSSATERGTIYTLGYARKDAVSALERLMRHARILLVDVRYQPVCSFTPQWNRASLAGRYGQRYVWERRLGNIHYRSRDLPVQLAPGSQHAIDEAVGLVCAGISLVLLCACADERACHRSYVAKLIQDALPVPARCTGGVGMKATERKNMNTRQETDHVRKKLTDRMNALTDQQVIDRYAQELLKLQTVNQFGRHSAGFLGYPNTLMMKQCRRELERRGLPVPPVNPPADAQGEQQGQEP